MTQCCCGPASQRGERSICPVDGSLGEPVRRLTVAAQMRGPLPPKQEFWLCPSRDCGVVYFGSEGTTVTTDEVHEIPLRRWRKTEEPRAEGPPGTRLEFLRAVLARWYNILSHNDLKRTKKIGGNALWGLGPPV